MSDSADPGPLDDCEVRLQRIEAAARVGSWTLELPAGRLHWSAETRRIFGVAADEPVSYARFLAAVHPDDREQVDAAWQPLLQGAAYNIQYRVLAGDTLRWVHERAGFEFDAGGSPLCALGIVQDITPQKRAEDNLRERYEFEQLVSRLSTRFAAELDLDALLDAALADLGHFTGVHRAHIFRFLDDGAIFDNTHEWCATGVVSQQANSRDLASADFPWWISNLRGGSLVRLADTADFPAEAEAEREICAAQDIRALLAMPFFAGGELVGCVGLEHLGEPRSWTDSQVRALRVMANLVATALERERTRGEVEELGRRLTLTLESMPEPFFTLDRDWRITYMNPEAEALLGVARGELLGRELWQSLPGALGSESERRYRQAMDSRQAARFEDYYPPQRRWFEIHAYPTEVGLAVYCRDLTAQRQAEAERKVMAEQVSQARQLEVVGQLAGGVAHDFNNMLSVILGHAELGLMQVGPEHPLYENLHEVREAGQRSAELVRQLLAFAQQQPIAPQALDLNAAVTATLKMLRPLVGEGVVLDWDPAGGLPRVRMDPTQVDQVLVNLVVNARDAVSGIGTIRLATGMVDLGPDAAAGVPGLVPGRYAEISVADDGIGMDAGTQARVFEPFYTTKPMGRGLGLGLSTVYGIVRQNQGHIAVESTPGQGATFRVWLPCLPTGQEVGALADQPEPLPGGVGTILVVEDEPYLRVLVESMLAKLGYEVLVAGSAAQALELAAQFEGQFSLLLTDVIMPGMSGRDLAAQLLERQPGLRVLFMSGYPADIIAPHGVLEPGLHFIQKPFRLTTLAERVRAALAE